MTKQEEITSKTGCENEDTGHSAISVHETIQQYTDLFYDAPFGYLTVDPSGQIIMINHAAANILATEVSSLTGKSFCALLDSPALEEFTGALAEAFRSNRKIICEFVLGGDKKEILIRAEAIVMQHANTCKIGKIGRAHV